MFQIAIQAAIGGKIIARETVKALAQERHRQVLRRRHHPQAQALEKQKEGKKRMRQVGQVEIPQEAFLAALKMS